MKFSLRMFVESLLYLLRCFWTSFIFYFCQLFQVFRILMNCFISRLQSWLYPVLLSVLGITSVDSYVWLSVPGFLIHISSSMAKR